MRVKSINDWSSQIQKRLNFTWIDTEQSNLCVQAAESATEIEILHWTVQNKHFIFCRIYLPDVDRKKLKVTLTIIWKCMEQKPIILRNSSLIQKKWIELKLMEGLAYRLRIKSVNHWKLMEIRLLWTRVQQNSHSVHNLICHCKIWLAVIVEISCR